MNDILSLLTFHRVFLFLFVLFCLVRARWHGAWAGQTRESTKSLRERFLALQLILAIVICHPGWLFGWFESWNLELYDALRVFGVFLMAYGLLLLEQVHRALGENFSPILELRQEHSLIRSGPYKRIRHPMYTSGFLFFIGAGLLSANLAVLLFPNISFLLLVLLRLPDEEKMLAERFGPEWDEHVRHTGAFIPWL